MKFVQSWRAVWRTFLCSGIGGGQFLVVGVDTATDNIAVRRQGIQVGLQHGKVAEGKSGTGAVGNDFAQDGQLFIHVLPAQIVFQRNKSQVGNKQRQTGGQQGNDHQLAA